MGEQKHTPEPWVIPKGPGIGNVGSRKQAIWSANGDIQIAICESDQLYYGANAANAQRIVACVNACSIFSNKELEEIALSSLYKIERLGGVGILLMEAANYQKQRDQLLAALKAANMALNVGLPEYSVEDALDIINDAIAAVEGGNQS